MVDMGDTWFNRLKKAKSNYNQALEGGNAKMAGEYSEECSRIYMTLARNYPMEHEKYVKQAKAWKNKANENDQTDHSSSIVRDISEGNNSENNFALQASALISCSSVKWDDIGGLEETKRLLMETIVVAGLQKPDSVKPWKGVLLFGPPGTGKTMLASACAGSLDATMFNVQGDKITSKYFGESSKILSSVYDVAKEKAPSIVFMDEIDGVAANRNTDASEASKEC